MKKYNLIPLLLLFYLAFMCYLGFPHYMSGSYSALRYFGVTALSLGCIIALRQVMKKRHERMLRNKQEQENQQ
ncbi:MAG: hypothetical protein NC082_05000 [Clostridiales bacterium]|nr:hypothetical protein [Clostridiales bacterium]